MIRKKYEEFKFILNLGSGKIDKKLINKNQFLVNVDIGYKSRHEISNIENVHFNILKQIKLNVNKQLFAPSPPEVYHNNSDIFDFIESYKFKFDLIIANRIFEHQFYDSGEIGRLLSGCYNILNDDGQLWIIVPNAKSLAKDLLNLEDLIHNMTHTEVQQKLLLINTEFHNSRCDPHGSIWTPQLAEYYIMSEGVWKVPKIIEDYNFAGRSCYMFICTEKK